jgi:hypothetical protein
MIYINIDFHNLFFQGALAFRRAHFGEGYHYQAIVLDNVECDGSEATLLQCSHHEWVVYTQLCPP